MMRNIHPIDVTVRYRQLFRCYCRVWDVATASKEPGRIALLGKLADPCEILQLGGLGFKHLKFGLFPPRFANREETQDADADFGAN
ncbi:hypothetical protein PspLS_06827 [Pyricularia sp. CBS 133598]|nr:hypothetical protein PspLS_06827 [Pyricularia sp. CBS 133598]